MKIAMLLALVILAGCGSTREYVVNCSSGFTTGWVRYADIGAYNSVVSWDNGDGMWSTYTP